MHRRLAIAGAAIAIVLGVVGAAPASARSHVARSHGTIPYAASRPATERFSAAPPCPSIDVCQTIPPQCPTGTTCPTVEAGPTTELGPGEWVTISLYDWSSSYAQVYYCQDTAPLSTPPLCADSGGEGLTLVNYSVQTYSTVPTTLSYQVEEVDTTSSPLDGSIPGIGRTNGKFFCNSATPCSIDVVDTGSGNVGNPTPSQATTAVIPVSFEPASSGCPSATTVNTQSEFGVDLLFPVAARVACQGANPSIAFNTAIDGLTALSSLASGSVSVAFTDDPEQADQQAVLSQGSYALIPIALSANVVGFVAENRQAVGQELFPLGSMELTPNMVAGLLTGYYNSAGIADFVPCPTSGCIVPPCQAGTKKHPGTNCSLLAQLNYQPGFLFTQQNEAFVRSDTAGSTGELFSWLCHAPNAAVTALGNPYTETDTGALMLETGLNPAGKPLAKCPSDEQYPPLPAGSTTYLAFDDPSQQSLKAYGFVTPGTQVSNVLGGFTDMNWADAYYYGLSTAAVQNAAGKFVTPSQSSLDAAVTDATTNADGTIIPNYATTDPIAYPMPSITYAVVPKPLSASAAPPIQAMLTQVLNLTAGADTNDLPQGFVPLPSALYQQAQQDIANLTTANPSSGGGGTSGGGGSSGGGGGPGGTGGSGGAGGSTGTGSPGSPVAATPATPASPTITPPAATGGGGSSASSTVRPVNKSIVQTGPHLTNHPGTSVGSPTGRSGPSAGAGQGSAVGTLQLVSSASRAFVPLVLLIGILFAVTGVLLFALPGFRRRVFVVAQAGAEGARRLAGSTSRAARSAPRWLSGRSNSQRPW